MVVVSCAVLQEDIGILIAVGIKIADTIEGCPYIGLIGDCLDISHLDALAGAGIGFLGVWWS